MKLICNNLNFEKKDHGERQILDPKLVDEILNPSKVSRFVCDNMRAYGPFAVEPGTAKLSRRHLEIVK